MKHIRVQPGAEPADIVQALMDVTQLSQAELARRSGFAGGQISKWRRGVTVPTVPVLARLADAAGFQLALLLPKEDA